MARELDPETSILEVGGIYEHDYDFGFIGAYLPFLDNKLAGNLNNAIVQMQKSGFIKILGYDFIDANKVLTVRSGERARYARIRYQLLRAAKPGERVV